MIGTKKECLHWLTDAKDAIYEVKEHHARRSKTANAYYWEMTHQLAVANRLSNTAQHNMNLRRYSKPLEIDHKIALIAIPDTEEAERMILENDSLHLSPTSYVQNERRFYRIMTGSSQLNKQEMARLIDGVADDMRELGLVPPPTRDVMQALEMIDEKQKNKSV